MLREDEAAQRSTAATGRGSDRSSLGLPVAFHCHGTQRRSGMRAEDSIGQPWGRGSMSPQSQWRARCHARCHGDRLPAPSHSRQPGGPVPPPGANCVPAPSPQGFPPSQPLQPGGRESRAADGPRSPRPAESKVGTGLGARRRCARLALELRAPSSHRQLLGWGPLAAAPPRCLPSSLQSALRRPARRLLSPALTNSFLLVPKGTLSGVAGTPQPVSRLAVSLQIHVPAEAGGSREPRAGGVLVGSTKMLPSSCLASIHLLCPAWGGGLVPSVKSGR